MSPLTIADGVRLGVQNHTWNSLYRKSSNEKTKQSLYELNLDQYAQLGASWNVVRVDQVSDGRDGFKRLDRILREHERRDIDVVLRLIEDPAVYAELYGDLSQEGERVEAYVQWVSTLTRFVGSRVSMMLIGNEIDKDISANLPRDRQKGPLFIEYPAYKHLLTKAYKAIKSVNPAIQVADHGVESYSLLSAVLKDMFDAGHDKAAVELCRRAFWGRDEFKHECEAFKRRLVSDANLKARAEKARLTFVDPGPADFFQIHLYMSADGMISVLDWIVRIQERTGRVRPIIATEVGYLLPASRSGILARGPRIADPARYSEAEHAAEMSKAIAVLAGRGINWIEIWEMRRLGESRTPVATLLKSSNDPKHIERYAAADAFQQMANALAGKVPITDRNLCQGECRQFAFEGGGERVTVAWSDAGLGSLSLPSTAQFVVTNVLGQTMRATNLGVRLYSLPVLLREPGMP